MEERLAEFQTWLDLVSEADDLSLDDYRQFLNDIIGECEDRVDASKLDVDTDEEEEEDLEINLDEDLDLDDSR